MSEIAPTGLHHVTAIASDPQRNVDFYTRVLGLRLVKQTVNFDAPDTYHLYYGDEAGRPVDAADVLPVARRAGRAAAAAGLTTATAFSVPPESLGWWQRRLRRWASTSSAPARPRRRGGADPARPGRPGDRPGRRPRRRPLRLGRRGPACPPSTPCAACTR